MSVIAHFSHAVFVVYLGVYVGSCTHKYDESASLANQCICMFVACSGVCMLMCVHTQCAYVLMHITGGKCHKYHFCHDEHIFVIIKVSLS